jgi:hypothetical protein
MKIISSLFVFAICFVMDVRGQVPLDYTPVLRTIESAPLGALRADVMKFLRTSGSEYSYDKPSRTIFMMIKKSQSGIVRTDIQIQFFFNEGDRLVQVTIKEVYTGP